MTSLLVVLALVVGIAGLLFFASQATSGPALVALGCLFGVLARVAQADKNHAALNERLDGITRRLGPVPQLCRN
jgi:hypothetical protein